MKHMILSGMKRNVIHTYGTAMQLKLTPLKIRKIQRIFALAVLIVVVLATFSSWSEFRFPTPNGQGASKLIIVLERVHLGVDDPREIMIKAVDKARAGSIDISRNDLLQLNLTSLSHGNTLTKLNVYELRLENGSANVFLSGPTAGVVRVTVTWKEGKSKLEPGEALIRLEVSKEHDLLRSTRQRCLPQRSSPYSSNRFSMDKNYKSCKRARSLLSTMASQQGLELAEDK
ncbi:hypothetical protein MUP59_09395 [Candidatus Bathyarchaeota archaeon]|nr:hypothetical protein [Candidatus Bathyarchaeota archaeon]